MLLQKQNKKYRLSEFIAWSRGTQHEFPTLSVDVAFEVWSALMLAHFGSLEGNSCGLLLRLRRPRPTDAACRSLVSTEQKFYFSHPFLLHINKGIKNWCVLIHILSSGGIALVFLQPVPKGLGTWVRMFPHYPFSVPPSSISRRVASMKSGGRGKDSGRD